MAPLELTSLDRVPAFTEPIRTALAPYWITSAEEFAATARLPNGAYADGLAALGSVLQLPPDALDMLYNEAVAASPRAGEYNVLVELEVGTGLLLGQLPPPSGVDFAPPIDLPAEVLLGSTLPPALDQGRRNTCVAFSMVAMYQIVFDDPTDLSEQFLFWACKQLDGMPDNPSGTTPQAAMQALATYGVCLEPEWQYVGEPLIGNVGQGPPPPAAEAVARGRRLTTGHSLESTKSRAVRTAIADGQPVLLGLPCYQYWTESGQSRRGGRVREALPGEAELGGHAVCAVGYRDEPSVPGGGYIIFRNSWSTDWGSENQDALGYGYVPYSFVDTHNRCAYVLGTPQPGDARGQAQNGEAGDSRNKR